MIVRLHQSHTVMSRLWRRTFGYDPSLNPTAIFNLSDEPTTRSCWSASAGRLPCPRTNSKLWSAKQDRICYRWSFFWPSESQRKRNMLWQQGWSLTLCRRTFPWPRSLDPWQDLHKSCLLFYLTCRRRVESSRVESCILTQSSVDSMFSPGNMMHVPSVGLVTLAALCSCRFK